MELKYAFLKDNHVVNVAVFAAQDDVLAQAVADEHGYDAFVFLADQASPLIGIQYEAGTHAFLALEPPVVEQTTVTQDGS